MKSKVELKEEMHFIGELENFKFGLDADEKFGGKNKGPKPKGLVLTALGGCTAMDVISILRKMKSEPEKFYVEVEADIADSQPEIFTKIIINYHFKGINLKQENLKKAIELSLDKYCAVAAMLKKTVNIEYKIIID